jgi:hypothetical protein
MELEREIALAELHRAQKIIVDSPARFKVVACGRRFGKTMIAVDMICEALLAGKAAGYFAPTYRMASEAWREIRRVMLPLTKYVSERDWRLEVFTGGVFECWSLAQEAGETARGRSYDLAVMDEAALLDSADVWHGAIRPTLTDRRGAALFASTPRGRNWFWELYRRGLSGEYPDWESWRLTTLENPHIDAEEVRGARYEMPERFFRQEYLAEFLDDGGAVFRNILAVCRGEREAATGGERYVFGVDWGKDRDFTCISVMTGTGRQVWLERFNQIGWSLQRGRLATLCARYQPSIILAEENSIGSVNIEALQSEGLPVRGFLTTSKSKAPLIENLALAMEREDVTLLDDDILKGELGAYEMKRLKLGWAYSAPSGGHDDTVMATALSLWASQRFGGVLIGWV